MICFFMFSLVFLGQVGVSSSMGFNGQFLFLTNVCMTEKKETK